MKDLLALCIAISPFAAWAAEDDIPGAHFIENWDQDGDGSVTVDELREKRAQVFFTFDSDDNGLLDAPEYASFDEARQADMEGRSDHGKGQMARLQGGMTMTFNDTNSDGTVSRDEFLGQTDAWMARIDRDEDGVVTLTDFTARD
ncbi:MAG: EF-hand domain-containing protein [Ruegeria sp.]